jgi:hypothetical protein
MKKTKIRRPLTERERELAFALRDYCGDMSQPGLRDLLLNFLSTRYRRSHF